MIKKTEITASKSLHKDGKETRFMRLRNFVPEENSMIAALIFIVVAPFVLFFSYGYYIKDFDGMFQNILVEAHGMVFDILVLGILFYHLQRLAEIRREKERYKEEIDDFRGWDSDEASHRISGNIRRLNKIQEYNLDLSDCYLKSAKISRGNVGIVLDRALIQHTNLEGAQMMESRFMETNIFNDSNFKDARLDGSKFDDCRISNAYFIKARLRHIHFSDTEMKGVMFNCGLLSDLVADNKTAFYFCSFHGAEIKNSIFRDCEFLYGHFSEANLLNTRFHNCVIRNSLFINSDLKNTVFDGSILIDSDFSESKSQSINVFSGAKCIINCRGIDEETTNKLAERSGILFNSVDDSFISFDQTSKENFSSIYQQFLALTKKGNENPHREAFTRDMSNAFFALDSILQS